MTRQWSGQLVVVTPPGVISQPHADYHSAPQYIVHIQGRKLRLMWPPSPKNLAISNDFQEHAAKEDRLDYFLNHLEGLELLWPAGNQVAFSLEPLNILLIVCNLIYFITFGKVMGERGLSVSDAQILCSCNEILHS